MWDEVTRIIRDHHRFLLTTHFYPDGDGVGAACALTELLHSLGKESRFVCDSEIPAKFAFLNYRNTYEFYDPEQDYSDVQVIFVLDAHRRERIGRVANIIEESNAIVVCIDHHIPTTVFTPHTFINVEACSVGALIYQLFKTNEISLNLEAAIGIYTSIICDTCRFSCSSTNQAAHQLAEECLRLGVNPDEMHMRLFQQVTYSQIELLTRVLQKMERHFDNRVLVQKIYRQDCAMIGVDFSDHDYIHEFNKTIKGLDCTILLRELPNQQIRVSMRSTSFLNIEKVMNALGGGGHSRAAGVCRTGTLDEVKGKVLELIAPAFN